MMAPSLISRAALASWLLMLKFLIASSSPTGSVTSMSTDVVDTIADETTSREITFEWSSNVSLLYPPRYEIVNDECAIIVYYRLLISMHSAHH